MWPMMFEANWCGGRDPPARISHIYFVVNILHTNSSAPLAFLCAVNDGRICESLWVWAARENATFASQKGHIWLRYLQWMTTPCNKATKWWCCVICTLFVRSCLCTRDFPGVLYAGNLNPSSRHPATRSHDVKKLVSFSLVRISDIQACGKSTSLPRHFSNCVCSLRGTPDALNPVVGWAFTPCSMWIYSFVRIYALQTRQQYFDAFCEEIWSKIIIYHFLTYSTYWCEAG